ncbi:RND superfamily putative drug exporter [Mycolicibacterium sp. BK556]|uniref:MMPL family transporter n=1 Tax=Mycobacteriaceae TaxID=1762 RepID=UPI00105C32F0|nr:MULTISPECIES: MMPL family transporter [Mycobacteriaceae]MBB3602131.1 RND superfamily putative drug exporter [Mycolicibacterium sp. BK556]MBB3631883.1 RND superfamily putative drug exporter [Mycolicibacterium sp. BK607]TDO18825.1 RND superfamily putative drug exporter [Mycobacterium sp. BK086]
MLRATARLAIAAPRRVVAIAILLMVAIGIFGVPVAKHLSPSGFADPNSQSSRATQLLTDKFGQGDVQLLVVVTATDRFDSPAVRTAALDVIDQLKRSGHVIGIVSPWTSPPQAAAALVSRDQKSGLITAGITGDESDQQTYAKELSDDITRDSDGIVVRTGGTAMVNLQVTEQSQHDLLLMESIAIPLSFLVLVWVFGGVFAAALPVAVGLVAILGALAVLRVTTFFTDVSIFALNLTTAMGLALAIDYTLLMISRYRDELAEGADRDEALTRTMMTAGRTVLFSATTVALSMGAMVLFPMHFLKSFAYAGVATVAFAALAAIVITPAAISLLGDRLDSLDVRRLFRRVFGRTEPVPRPIEQQFWYRSTKFVMRRAIPIGLAGVVVLVILGAPFLGVRPGFPDDRVLPSSASAHQVGDQLRGDFTNNSETAIPVLIPDAGGLSDAQIARYAADLSRVADVSAVSAPMGAYVGGNLVGPPSAATALASGSALLTVESSAPLFSDRSAGQLDRLHEVSTPGNRTVEFAGTAQTNRDSVDAITSRLPAVLGLIAAIMLVLLFLLTGSVVLPLKALVLNVLSLTAAFGAMVWIFQDGHLGAFGTTSTGTLVANMPVLLFCIAFGLSMDYEVFLVSRIREFWLASPQGGVADNDESVALGVAHTGRVITAAALIMAISFAALIAAHVSFMRMFGLGLALAVLADATLVRLILVPAFMHVMGRWNWWAPKPLAWMHQRVGIRESGPARHTG